MSRPGLHPLRVALAIFLASAVAAMAQLPVRVLDYNIHRDIGATDSNLGSQPALAKVVNYLRPDVWTINELGGNSVTFNETNARTALVNFINGSLTIFGANPQVGIDYFVYVGELTDGYITNAIVSRYPLLSTQTFSDAGNSYAALRGLTMALVDLPGATDLGVFTAHLKAQNNTASAERRQAEADTDAATVSGWISGHMNTAAVLTGDWNETEDAGETTNWSAHQIGNALPSNGKPYHPITTMKSTGLFDPQPLSIAGKKDTIDSASPNARFDYLLYTPGSLSITRSEIFDTKQYSASALAGLNSTNSTNFTAGDSASASDHLPVFAVFMVVPEPSVAVFLVMGICAAGAMRRRRG